MCEHVPKCQSATQGVCSTHQGSNASDEGLNHILSPLQSQTKLPYQLPHKQLTLYPPPAIRRHKSVHHKSWMGRLYARGQLYPLPIDSYNNNASDEELLLGDEIAPQRNPARFFVIGFVLLFMLLLLYVPVYHQVQVREVGMMSFAYGVTGGLHLMLDNFLLHCLMQMMNSMPQVAPIDGWARNSSRDLRRYVQPNNLTALIEQPSVCNSTSPLLLLVIVCSSVGNFDARQAIRDTWGSASNDMSENTLRLTFLLGATKSEELQNKVKQESLSYSDVIQEGFLDTYNNLTLKSVMLLKWVRLHCRHAHYVMKTDDDMFVNLGRLVTQLRADAARVRPNTIEVLDSHLPDLALRPRGLLLGALICGAKPIPNPLSKWYAPRYMYPEHMYPNYLSGTGYVMSADVVRRLYEAALKTPLFHLEDVYITGMCAKAAGLKPHDHPGFSYQRCKLEPCAYRNSLITSHRLNSTDLRLVWQRINAKDLQCPAATTAVKKKVRKGGGRANRSCV